MIYFQTPSPTPTPIPLSQVGQTVSQLTDQSRQLYDTVLQYGALGILGLFVFFMILGALAVILYIYTTRNRKTNGSENTTTPLVSLAKSIETLAQSSIASIAEAAKTREMYADTNIATNERLSVNTSAVEENTEIVADLKARVGEMLTKGSKPLQEATTTIREATTKIGELITLVSQIQTDQERTQTSLEEIIQKISELQISLTDTRQAAETKLEEIKETTGKLQPVVNPTT